MNFRSDLHPARADSRDDMNDIQTAVRQVATEHWSTEITLSNEACVTGVDQAFPDQEVVVSAAVTHRDTQWLEQTYHVKATTVPYIPGYLAFREGPGAIAALRQLRHRPDVVLIDGNGRLHPRQVGLATHVGVVVDIPTIGVAKRLLCGTPKRPIEALPAGTVVPILADEDVVAPQGTIIGYAVQTRQFDSAHQSINPVFVSAGFGITGAQAVRIVLDNCRGYKLPEAIRTADRYADRVSSDGEIHEKTVSGMRCDRRV